MFFSCMCDGLMVLSWHGLCVRQLCNKHVCDMNMDLESRHGLSYGIFEMWLASTHTPGVGGCHTVLALSHDHSIWFTDFFCRHPPAQVSTAIMEQQLKDLLLGSTLEDDAVNEFTRLGIKTVELFTAVPDEKSLQTMIIDRITWSGDADKHMA